MDFTIDWVTFPTQQGHQRYRDVSENDILYSIAPMVQKRIYNLKICGMFFFFSTFVLNNFLSLSLAIWFRPLIYHFIVFILLKIFVYQTYYQSLHFTSTSMIYNFFFSFQSTYCMYVIRPHCLSLLHHFPLYSLPNYR